MSRRVLFVDDEINILDGLRRTFRHLRREWDMEFACGGAAALALMESNPVDVVVSDMRMPGMDGDVLLAEVRDKFPQTVRIVLTGQCTRESMLRVAPVAHRFLIKPCDPELLKSSVIQASNLCELMTNPSLLAIVGQLNCLPTPDALHSRIVSMLDQHDTSLEAIGELVEQDMSIASKLLQVANSVLFGGRFPTSSPAQAIKRLGMDMTKALIFVANVFTRHDGRALHPYSIDDVWGHCQQVGVLAASIASSETRNEQVIGEARMAGLLHDIGRLVLSTQQPAKYKEVFQLIGNGNIDILTAEERVFGTAHPAVGAYLLGLWGLPTAIAESVAWHHDPCKSLSTQFESLTAVHVAEGLTAPDEGSELCDEYLARLGLADRVPAWAKLRAADVERYRHA